MPTFNFNNLKHYVDEHLRIGLEHAHRVAKANYMYGSPSLLLAHWLRHSEYTAGRWTDEDILAAMDKIEAEEGYAAQTEIANSILKIIVAYLNNPEHVTALVENAKNEYAAATAPGQEHV